LRATETILQTIFFARGIASNPVLAKGIAVLQSLRIRTLRTPLRAAAAKIHACIAAEFPRPPYYPLNPIYELTYGKKCSPANMHDMHFKADPPRRARSCWAGEAPTEPRLARTVVYIYDARACRNISLAAQFFSGLSLAGFAEPLVDNRRLRRQLVSPW
jgi:hypothetical protein